MPRNRSEWISTKTKRVNGSREDQADDNYEKSCFAVFFLYSLIVLSSAVQHPLWIMFNNYKNVKGTL